jgi:L-serine dehydratase
VVSDKCIPIHNQKVSFNPETDIAFLKSQSMPFHPNAIQFDAEDINGKIFTSIYYSIGGGFIVKEGEKVSNSRPTPKFSYQSADQLLNLCNETGSSISEIVLANELTWKGADQIKQDLLRIWNVMKEAAYLGCHTEGILPGGLQVKRRAFEMNKQLLRVHDYKNANDWIEAMKVGRDFRKVITRISCLAIAVNEVNASMGRIVTAPTNGSSGVIPAVLFYYLCFSGQEVKEDDIVKFLLTAGEIGKFFKIGATISAAAGGCQAEIGVSSSMAAAALTEVMGGRPSQVLMAAEIAAEHHLGLTCDPIGGLVQIPCIERNTMGAVKAVTASMIALASDPSFAKVSLDNVIKTMKETAENMNSKYKETSMGGLAVNVGVNLPEC